MQKLINVLALASFAVSAGVVGAGAYVYLNKDALIDQAKDKVAEEIAGLLPELVGSLLPKPELPGLPGGGGATPATPPLFNPFN